MVFFLLLFPPWMPTEIFAPGTATSSPRSRNTRQTPSTAWTVFGAWTVLAAVASTTTTTTTRTAEALRLGFGLPGGGRVSYRDGLLRIQPPAPKDTETETPSSNAKTFEVPWDQAVAINPESSRAASEIGVGIDIGVGVGVGVGIEIEIENRETASKGYGAFYVGSTPLEGGSFLGLYEGRLVTPREALDRLHARRRKELLDTGSEEDAKKVGDYVLSLDGGVHFLDGFDLRYKGSKNSDENNDEHNSNNNNNSSSSKQPFTPAHLNHADKGGPGCNVLRKLVYLPDDFCFDKPSDTDTDTSPGTGTKSAGGTFRVGDYPRNLPRVAFFAAREISTGEELAFDYGANFWKT